jgi:cytochrome P450
LFLFLGKHDDVFNKLRRAVLMDFGTKDDPREITFYNLKKCQYLQWCLYETLRLCPPAPINLRVALRNTTLPTGGGPDGKSPVAVRKG